MKNNAEYETMNNKKVGERNIKINIIPMKLAISFQILRYSSLIMLLNASLPVNICCRLLPLFLVLWYSAERFNKLFIEITRAFDFAIIAILPSLFLHVILSIETMVQETERNIPHI